MKKVKIYKRGDVAWLGTDQVRVLRQVLFNRPAYRVARVKKKGDTPGSWVVDGHWLTDAPYERKGLFG